MHSHQTVLDRNQEPIGVIVDIIPDAFYDLPLLAVRTSLFGVPRLVPAASVSEEWPDVRVPYDAQTISGGPRWRHRASITDTDRVRVLNHYGLSVFAGTRVERRTSGEWHAA